LVFLVFCFSIQPEQGVCRETIESASASEDEVFEIAKRTAKATFGEAPPLFSFPPFFFFFLCTRLLADQTLQT
jgi:hypothetical protein